jgi:hypothetical protein
MTQTNLVRIGDERALRAKVDEAVIVHAEFVKNGVDSEVLTPPYTPLSRSLHQNSLKSENGSGHISSAAAAYFESRPVLPSLDTDQVQCIHWLEITNTTRPEDLPYPQPHDQWLERDVLPQDWETFVNFLIPLHAATSNNDLADRKLKAELIDERMSRLTLDQDVRRYINPQQVEAQLDPMRKIHSEYSGISDAETVVNDWNEGFFIPRGLKVELSQGEVADDMRMPMPGSWTDNMDEPTTSAAPCGGRRGGRGFGGGWVRADNTGFHLGRNLLSADNQGM